MIQEVYGDAFQQFMERPVPWLIFYAVHMVAGVFTLGLGYLFLLPNVIRETQASLNENRDPVIGQLFDMSMISEDAVAMVIFGGAIMVGSMLCGIPGIIAGVLLYMMPMIRGGNMVNAMDSAKLSVAFVKENLADTVIMMVVSSVLMSVASSVVVGAFVAWPIVGLAMVGFYKRYEEALRGLAQTAGMELSAPAMIPEG